MAEFVGDRKYYTAINSPSLWKSKDAIRVKQAFNDTIYTISEQGLTPYLVFELGEWHWNEQQQLDVEGCDKNSHRLYSGECRVHLFPFSYKLIFRRKSVILWILP